MPGFWKKRLDWNITMDFMKNIICHSLPSHQNSSYPPHVLNKITLCSNPAPPKISFHQIIRLRLRFRILSSKSGPDVDELCWGWYINYSSIDFSLSLKICEQGKLFVPYIQQKVERKAWDNCNRHSLQKGRNVRATVVTGPSNSEIQLSSGCELLASLNTI